MEKTFLIPRSLNEPNPWVRQIRYVNELRYKCIHWINVYIESTNN